MEFNYEREFADEWRPPANPAVVEGIMKHGEVSHERPAASTGQCKAGSYL